MFRRACGIGSVKSFTSVLFFLPHYKQTVRSNPPKRWEGCGPFARGGVTLRRGSGQYCSTWSAWGNLAHRERLRDLAVYFPRGYTGSQPAIRRTADGRRPAIQDVGADHCGGHFLVPQQFLHGPDIIPVFFEEMCRKRSVAFVVVLSREGWKRSRRGGDWGPRSWMGLTMRLSVSTAKPSARSWGGFSQHRSSCGAIDTEYPYGCQLTTFRKPRRHAFSGSRVAAS